MSSGGEKPKPWRPWRFSLRLLLLAMFGVSMFFAGWTANDATEAARRMKSSKGVWLPPNPSPPPPADALIELRGPPAIEIDLSREAVKESESSDKSLTIGVEQLP